MVRFRRMAFMVTLTALAASAVVAGSAGAKSGRPHEMQPRLDLPHRVVVSILPNAKENTSVIAQNNGSAAATIAMDIYTPAGVPISGAGKQSFGVAPGGTTTFAQAINGGLTPGFRGVGIISSDQPVNAVLVRDLEENGTFRHGYSIHNAFASGANVVTLPFIANNHANVFQTRFAIANTGGSVACVTIAYAFDGGGGTNDVGVGGSGCATGYPVPVNGQIAFAPNAVDGAIPMPAATAGKLMSATITSTGSPVTVAVDAYRLNNGRFQIASYDGFVVGDAASTTDDLGTTVSAPVGLKIDGFYTQYLMSNPTAGDANVTITYRSEGGQTYTATRVIPGNGTDNHGVYSADGGVPEGFQGAATITSDKPIAVLIVRAKMTSPGSFVDEDLYTAVSGVPNDRAALTAKAPLIFRRAYGNSGVCDVSGVSCGYNTWISVSVPGGGTANVSIQTIPDTTTGAPGCTSSAPLNTTRAVTGSYIFYQNAIHGGSVNNGLGANPNCLWGGATITSDVPIIVVVDITSDGQVGDNDGLYNGFNN